jgi:hypothetical protein
VKEEEKEFLTLRVENQNEHYGFAEKPESAIFNCEESGASLVTEPKKGTEYALEK